MKNLFSFILSIYLFPHIYAMENKKMDINTAFKKAVEDAIKNPSQEDFKEIENCLNQGADINSQIRYHAETAIILAVQNSNKKLFDFLLHKGADINSHDCLGNTPIYIALTEKLACFDIEKDFLKRGADPNTKTLEGEGALLHSTIIKFGTINSIKLLIKYGANINKKDFFGRAPLYQAISYCNFEAIEELCNLGARLDNIDSHRCNAFHVAISKKFPKSYINLLIINSRFDSYHKEIDEQLEKIVLETLLIFKQLNKTPNFPKVLIELQWRILSHLALNNLYGFNRKLCQQLEAKNIKNILLNYTLNKVDYVENVLQGTDRDYNTALEKTALQTLYNKHQNNLLYIQEVESLVDPKKLQQDRIDFMNGLVLDDNLVAQIYEQSKKLLFKS